MPGASIVLAGAMCAFGVTPNAAQGDPARWADELDRLVELAPIVVPGHGPVGGEEEVRDLQAYLRAVRRGRGRRRPPRRRAVARRGRAPPSGTPSTSSGPPCSPRAATNRRPTLLRRLGLA